MKLRKTTRWVVERASCRRGGERRIEVRCPIRIRPAWLEGPGQVNDRVRVAERRREVIFSSERSDLVGQLIETPPQRGTYLSACAGHGHGTSSPSHAHRLP
jgi:hypothetical protein